jgi:hypothetical protein
VYNAQHDDRQQFSSEGLLNLESDPRAAAPFKEENILRLNSKDIKYEALNAL